MLHVKVAYRRRCIDVGFIDEENKIFTDMGAGVTACRQSSNCSSAYIKN